MDRLRLLTVVLVATLAAVLAWADPAGAQIRVQETPAIDGLGSFLFRDVSIQLDAGYGNDSPILSGDEDAATRASAGIFMDKPFVSYFLDILYDRDRQVWEPFQRDTPWRDFLIEPFRAVAHYRVGNFAVLRDGITKTYTGEFYVGIRYKLDLDRLFRHIPSFQK